MASAEPQEAPEPREPRASASLHFPEPVVEALRTGLPEVSDEVVAAVVAEVPSYSRAFAGPMGDTIRTAVALALDGFLDRVAPSRRPHGERPADLVRDGAYDLGRGEARSGRSMDALLSAYRVGARVAWLRLSTDAVAAGVTAERMAVFAEMVFAYIDELSAFSVAGHNDELETTGRVRQRLRERVARMMLTAAPADAVASAAARAEWEVPHSLTCVLISPSRVRAVITALGVTGTRTLVAAEDVPGLPEDLVALVVPDLDRTVLLQVLGGQRAVVGPTRPWGRAASSYERAVRAVAEMPRQDAPLDCDEHLPRLVLAADPEALTDLRTRMLAPLDDVRPATRARLEETLRAWLLCQGRRDDVAAALFVHPQTVRYRMGQLRDLFGDRLTDPTAVHALVLALGPP